MEFKKEIEKTLHSIGVNQSQFFEEEGKETLVLFNHEIEEKSFDFMLIYSLEQNMIVFNLMMKFPQPYADMEADFYEVINKLNDTAIFGYLGIIGDEELFLAYKSSYIGDAENLLGNKSFENFFNVSFDMVGYFHSQLN